MAKYASTSPYYRTRRQANYLGIYEPRTFNINNDDIEYKIGSSRLTKIDNNNYDVFLTADNKLIASIMLNPITGLNALSSK